jgi:signal transduction histidine kinase
LVLAGVFLLAIWFDPSQPSRYTAEAYSILACYVTAAGLYLAATWNNWWLEHRLAPLAHVFDVALFAVMVFLTEGYTSPFFTFFVFIVLSATIKWGWRETAITSAIIILLFFAAGWAALESGAGDFDTRRFVIRGTYLVVLSLVLIWFGINQQGMHLRQHGSFQTADEGDPAELPIRRSLEHTAARTAAQRVAFIWSDKDEPWTDFAMLNGSEFSQQRYGPGAFGEIVHSRLSGCTFVFDAERGRAIFRCEGRHNRLGTGVQPIDPELRRRLKADSGLAIPVECENYSGVILATGIAGLSSDDLAIGDHIADEVSAALHRASTISLSEEAAASRTRLSLTRDIHDSIIQLLAGTSFRLQGMRKSAEAGRSIGTDIDALQQELSTEQRQLRTFIGELRGEVKRTTPAGLCGSVRHLLERMGRQWDVECELLRCPEALQVSPRLDHEVHQILREGIANAVRHGGADHISVSLDVGETGISMIVADNGSGFPVQQESDEAAGKAAGPWSLNERIHDLGGDLALYSSPRGSRLTISLPFGTNA